MISTLPELLDEAGAHRTDDMPTLYVLGNLDRHAEPDMVVMKEVGRINSNPVFKFQPRIWSITDEHGLEICDDYEDWMELNDERVVFPSEAIRCVLVANPSNEEFATRPESWKFLTYPPLLDK